MQILQTLLTFLFVNLLGNTDPKVMSRFKSPTALGIGYKADFNQQQKLCNTKGCDVEKTFHCPSPKNPLVLCACGRCPWGPNPWLWEPTSKGKKKIWNMTFDCNLDILVLLYFSGIRHPITWEFLVICLFLSPPKDGYTLHSNAELRVSSPSSQAYMSRFTCICAMVPVHLGHAVLGFFKREGKYFGIYVLKCQEKDLFV